MKTSERAKRVRFTEALLEQITRAFFYSYFSAAGGETETELLIDFDIEAAACDTDEGIREIIRNTIKRAVQAVDQGVPFWAAQQALLVLLLGKAKAQPTPQPIHPRALTHIRCPWCGDIVPTDQPLHDCQA